jgi:chromosomal replication initiation ATPase DnaA
MAWSDYQTAVSRLFKPGEFDAWLLGSGFYRRDDAIVVVVDKLFKRNWIANHYSEKLRAVLGAEVEVVLRDDPVLPLAPTSIKPEPATLNWWVGAQKSDDAVAA